MTTTTDLLRLTQWLSPAFPISGFAYSHGLEAAMAQGRVTDAASTKAWVSTVLTMGAGALDAWVIRTVMAGQDPAEMADLLQARAGSAERWEETRAQGAAFVATTNAMGATPLGEMPLPVAVALRARDMDPTAVIALYLHGFASSIVSAATRFLPLGQAEAQTILQALHPIITDLSQSTSKTPPGSAALLAELDAMAHETQTARLFRT
ncbi:MAG: urease accessory UreF family protein [Pseudomonadota bacterium]